MRYFLILIAVLILACDQIEPIEPTAVPTPVPTPTPIDMESALRPATLCEEGQTVLPGESCELPRDPQMRGPRRSDEEKTVFLVDQSGKPALYRDGEISHEHEPAVEGRSRIEFGITIYLCGSPCGGCARWEMFAASPNDDGSWNIKALWEEIYDGGGGVQVVTETGELKCKFPWDTPVPVEQDVEQPANPP